VVLRWAARQLQHRAAAAAASLPARQMCSQAARAQPLRPMPCPRTRPLMRQAGRRRPAAWRLALARVRRLVRVLVRVLVPTAAGAHQIRRTVSSASARQPARATPRRCQT
jgi:hypothetical protein